MKTGEEIKVNKAIADVKNKTTALLVSIKSTIIQRVCYHGVEIPDKYFWTATAITTRHLTDKQPVGCCGCLYQHSPILGGVISIEENEAARFLQTFKYFPVWKKQLCCYIVVGRWALIRQIHYWFKLPRISLHPWLEMARADQQEDDSEESMLTWRLVIAFVLQFVITVACWAYNEAWTFG